MPSVLVLGGVGFIGRNFVTYLVENNLAEKIRVADKALPATSYLSPVHKVAFEDPRVEFRQANLVNPATVEKIFAKDDGSTFDYVFNCAAETKYGQSEEVYDEKIFNLSVTVAKEAAKRKVKAYVELSTAQVYESDKKPSSEESKVKPWTLLAKYKLKAEEEVKKIAGLNLVILRPAIVYGPGDILGITPRLIIGAVYRQLKETMKLLWTKDLKINTVHVTDVVRAMWSVAATTEEKGLRKGPVKSPEIYNLADKSDSAGVANTPLTPYLDKELLKDNALSIDGSKIEKDLGFVYSVPQLTEASLREVITRFEETGIWPKGTTK
ncbi:hypothetical protein HDU96_009498 [Phlyctochytrium bullatum]|nr:hypothetical protein HDU96_009498 [Phlyctochytrium bullatum]